MARMTSLVTPLPSAFRTFSEISSAPGAMPPTVPSPGTLMAVPAMISATCVPCPNSSVTASSGEPPVKSFDRMTLPASAGCVMSMPESITAMRMPAPVKADMPAKPLATASAPVDSRVTAMWARTGWSRAACASSGSLAAASTAAVSPSSTSPASSVRLMRNPWRAATACRAAASPSTMIWTVWRVGAFSSSARSCESRARC